MAAPLKSARSALSVSLATLRPWPIPELIVHCCVARRRNFWYSTGYFHIPWTRTRSHCWDLMTTLVLLIEESTRVQCYRIIFWCHPIVQYQRLFDTQIWCEPWPSRHKCPDETFKRWRVANRNSKVPSSKNLVRSTNNRIS